MRALIFRLTPEDMPVATKADERAIQRANAGILERIKGAPATAGAPGTQKLGLQTGATAPCDAECSAQVANVQSSPVLQRPEPAIRLVWDGQRHR